MKYFEITLTTKSPILMGGVTYDPVIDNATAVRNGRPYIPASAFKGALRLEFESLMRLLGEEVCDIGENSEEAVDSNTVTKEGCGKCIVCRLFGGGGNPGKLRFNDLELLKGEHVSLTVRNRTTINRKTGRAAEKKLFNAKLAPPNLDFIGKIEIVKPLTEDEQKKWVKFLDYLKITGLSIGANRSIGMGRVKIDYEEKSYEGPEIILEDGDWDFHVLTVRLLEPLNVGFIRYRYVMPTLRFIPGSTIRGALAFALLENGVDENEIARFFIKSENAQALRFSNFYIESQEPELGTMRRPKRSQDSEIDVVIDDFLLKQIPESEELYSRVFKKGDNVLEPVPTDPGEADVRLFTRLTINRVTGSAHEERLYTIEAIVPPSHGLVYKGYVWMPSKWVKFLKGLEIKIGGRSTKGFGKAKIEGIIPAGEDFSFEDRVGKFNKKLKERVEKFKIHLDDRVYFTIDLISDVALPEGTSFREYLVSTFSEIEGVKIEHAWLKTEERGGFDALKTMKDGYVTFKPRITLIKRGSVILLSVPSGSWGDTKKVLTNLLKAGIGDRTYEGFGFINVCDARHYL